ncbi:hypothetical protein IM792_18330 [Mucilaginibacter sp. JRF]|nr:hypothetical protein [Mucilaginibacter sp. JRF]
MILFCGMINMACKANSIKADSLLTLLKKELTLKQRYDMQVESKIICLKERLRHPDHQNLPAQFKLNYQIFEMYRAYKFDSAFVYVNKMIGIAEKMNNRQQLIKSKILLGWTFLNCGFYKEGFNVMDELRPDELPIGLKSDYLILRSRLYEGNAEYNNDNHYSRLYSQRSKEDLNDAVKIAPVSEFEGTINKAFLPPDIRDKKLTVEYYYKYIMGHKLGAHAIAMVATRLSFAFTGEDRIFFLALGAIHDIRSATKETLAVFLLGQELYKINRTEEAYFFMQEAASNAKFYGARSREVQIQSLLPIVATKLLAEKQHEKDKLLIGVLIVLIIVIILFFLLVIYRKQLAQIKANEHTISFQNTELRNMNEKLWESSRIKEELIGLFLKTCSAYIDTLDRVKRKTLHNIKTGKYNDIKPILDSLHIDKEKESLYETLDSGFIKIFPNFISSFNNLLSKEDQIWPKRSETLNPTLRIFALMRLGINELPTVAKILGYSESTVYSYKVRVKAKALVQGNDFEQSIMNIRITA